eukprot:scpid28933/ scgid3973/ Leucine-rich repeat-containing protein 15; Leucine-rich repeat protein induced by beta-amyloid
MSPTRHVCQDALLVVLLAYCFLTSGEARMFRNQGRSDECDFDDSQYVSHGRRVLLGCPNNATQWVAHTQNLTGLAPGAFGDHTENIFISINSIRTLPEDVFANNINLTRLTMSSNKLDTLPSGLLAHNVNLKYLKIDRNNLTSIPEGFFDHNPDLISLDLDSNRLSSLPQGLFDGKTKLMTLDLDSNRLSSLPQGLFDGKNKLATVKLAGNAFSSVPSALLGYNPELRRIYLDNNNLTKIPTSLFIGKKQPTSVYLRGNPFPLNPHLCSIKIHGSANTIVLDKHVQHFLDNNLTTEFCHGPCSSIPAADAPCSANERCTGSVLDHHCVPHPVVPVTRHGDKATTSSQTGSQTTIAAPITRELKPTVPGSSLTTRPRGAGLSATQSGAGITANPHGTSPDVHNLTEPTNSSAAVNATSTPPVRVNSKKSGLSTGFIILLICAIICMLLAVMGIMFFMTKKDKRKKHGTLTMMKENGTSTRQQEGGAQSDYPAEIDYDVGMDWGRINGAYMLAQFPKSGVASVDSREDGCMSPSCMSTTSIRWGPGEEVLCSMFSEVNNGSGPSSFILDDGTSADDQSTYSRAIGRAIGGSMSTDNEYSLSSNADEYSQHLYDSLSHSDQGGYLCSQLGSRQEHADKEHGAYAVPHSMSTENLHNTEYTHAIAKTFLGRNQQSSYMYDNVHRGGILTPVVSVHNHIPGSVSNTTILSSTADGHDLTMPSAFGNSALSGGNGMDGDLHGEGDAAFIASAATLFAGRHAPEATRSAFLNSALSGENVMDGDLHAEGSAFISSGSNLSATKRVPEPTYQALAIHATGADIASYEAGGQPEVAGRGNAAFSTLSAGKRGPEPMYQAVALQASGAESAGYITGRDLEVASRDNAAFPNQRSATRASEPTYQAVAVEPMGTGSAAYEGDGGQPGGGACGEAALVEPVRMGTAESQGSDLFPMPQKTDIRHMQTVQANTALGTSRETKKAQSMMLADAHAVDEDEYADGGNISKPGAGASSRVTTGTPGKAVPQVQRISNGEKIDFDIENGDVSQAASEITCADGSRLPARSAGRSVADVRSATLSAVWTDDASCFAEDYTEETSDAQGSTMRASLGRVHTDHITHTVEVTELGDKEYEPLTPYLRKQMLAARSESVLCEKAQLQGTEGTNANGPNSHRC